MNRLPWSPAGMSYSVESTCNAEDPSSILRLGRSAGEGIGYPLQCSYLENSKGHKESDTTEWLSLSLFTFIILSCIWNVRHVGRCLVN